MGLRDGTKTMATIDALTLALTGMQVFYGPATRSECPDSELVTQWMDGNGEGGAEWTRRTLEWRTESGFGCGSGDKESGAGWGNALERYEFGRVSNPWHVKGPEKA